MARRYRDEYEYEQEATERRRRSRRESVPDIKGRKVARGVKVKKEEKKSPFLLRFLSWLGVILLCFVAGYLGTSYMMDMLNKKLLLKPENRISNQADLQAMQDSEQERSRTVGSGSGEVQQVSLNVYYVQNETLNATPKSFVARAQEDNISDALRMIFSLSNIPNSDSIKVLHVFRNTDMVFLDLSSSFVQAISEIGEKKSLLLLTGIVRTIQENFSPIVRVRFLIDSRLPEKGGTVDLSVTWQLPSRSA